VGAASLDAPVWTELLALTADWLWEMDHTLRIVRVRPLVPQRALPRFDHVIGFRPWESPAFRSPRGVARRQWRSVWRREPFRHIELSWLDDAGRLVWTAISGIPRHDEHGCFTGYHGVAVDITLRKRLEQSLHEARAELDATLQALPDLMFEVDAHGTIWHVHAPRPQLLAAPIERILGQSFHGLLPAEVAACVAAAVQQALEHGQCHGVQYRLSLADGEHWFELSAARKAPVAGGEQRVVLLVRDISEAKAREAELRALAFYDPLTGLANRRLLLDRVEQALLRQRRSPSWAALLFIDADNFKAVNDGHGHASGDAVLVELARRLRGCVRDTDPHGRLAGDEFLALLEDLGSDLAEAQRVAQRIARKLVEVLSRPYHVSEHGFIDLSVSVGVVVFRGAHPVGELLDCADRLLYRAKDAGKRRVRMLTLGERA
jgi:diguanylate cyclase (GGDEF)-like protein/PAS domain S-box-containing protein